MAINHAAGLFTVDIVAAAQANVRLRRVPASGVFAQDLNMAYAPAPHGPRTSHLAVVEADADETDHFVASTEPRA